jgi:hypothetical protein
MSFIPFSYMKASGGGHARVNLKGLPVRFVPNRRSYLFSRCRLGLRPGKGGESTNSTNLHGSQIAPPSARFVCPDRSERVE